MKFILLILTTNLVFGLNSSLSDSSSFTRSEIRFYSDVIIDSSETLKDNIRVLGGTLNVYGTVESQITVIGGDVHIFPSAHISGKIVAIGGDVITDEGATISGKVVEASMDQGLIYRETFTDSAASKKKESFGITNFSHRFREGWVHPEPEVFEHNRNEGFRFSPLNWNWDRGNESLIRLSFSVGYRFGPDEFIGRSTLETALLKNRTATLFASGFKTARTDDEFRLPEHENSWASLIGRQDFFDRWDETGFEAGAGFDFSLLKLKGKYVKATQTEMVVNSNVWSLFHEKRTLRENPSMLETDVEYVEGILAFRTASYTPLSTGFALLSKIEMTIKENNETLDEPTLRMSHMAIANLKLSEGVVLRNRVILGMASETVPTFRQFGIGGLGSVSAHDFKIQSGTHMGQMNSELIFTEDFTDTFFMVILFFDAGMAYSTSTLVDLNYIVDHSDQFIQSAGIGFGNDDGDGKNMRINFAKQLGSDGPIESTVRYSFNF